GTDRPPPGPRPVTGPLPILMGPMGAGTSRVRSALAAQLGVDFADLDTLIVAADGRTIPEISAAEAEPAFREREAAVPRRALAQGAGAPLHRDAGELLRGRPVLLLEIEAAVAARRLARGTGRRMLEGSGPMARWRQLAQERGPTYRDLATCRIGSGHGGPAHV